MDNHPVAATRRRPGTARAALLLLVFVLFPSLCHAGGPWEKTDYALAGAAVAALAVDWGQTRHIAKNPNRFSEQNPILGPSPAVGKVDAYFVGAIVGTVALAHALPSDWRQMFLAGVLTVELGVVQQNRSLGIKMAF
ncbi:MAG: hypothetical protein ACJ8G5_09335 [Burkholderiales bacterium]